MGDKNRKAVNKRYERNRMKTKSESSFLSSLFSNMYIEHYEKSALDTLHKLTIWFRFVDDTFVVMPHGSKGLQICLIYISSLRPSIQFTGEQQQFALSGCVTYQNGSSTVHRGLQKTDSYWLLCPFWIQPSTSCRNGC